MIVEGQKSGLEQMVVNGTPLKKEEKTYKEFKEFKKETNKSQREKNKNKKYSMMKTVATLFLVGMVLVVRYSIIYANQKQISNIKSEISSVQYRNDDLKVYLLKFNDIKNVDETARNKNKMVEPGVNNTYYYDLSKDNFKNDKEKNNGGIDIIEKIKKYLF